MILEYESTINFVCYTVMIIGFLFHKDVSGWLEGLLGLLVATAFATALMSVIINGVYKGF